MPELSVYSSAGEPIQTVPWNLEEGIEGTANAGALHQVANAQLAGRRQGTAATKTRAEVRGGGRKPWRQKGTGRARQGSRRAPHWSGGGVVFGPHPRSYRQVVPRRLRKLAWITAWSQKVADGEVLLLDTLAVATSGKTKELAEILSRFSLGTRVLLVPEEAMPMLTRAARNLRGVTVVPVQECSVLDLLHADTVMTTMAAMESIGGARS